jgi:hypothetical protein
MLQAFVQSVSCVSDDVLIRMLHIIHTYMLQKYVPNVSTVSFLCCSKYFHVASILSGCYIYFTHMLQVYAPNILLASDLCCI